MLNSPTGPAKETIHTQFLFWHREKYVVKKNGVYMQTTMNYLPEKLTVKTMKIINLSTTPMQNNLGWMDGKVI